MSDRRLKILNVVGARPNFIKIAPLMEAYRGTRIDPILVHTGQHYDAAMSDSFFRELSIPDPDVNLGVGRGTRTQQVSSIMLAFEPVVHQHRPDAVVVVGDVNSTLACALVAANTGTKLIHVEAGLRSGDRSMPEETNRIVTDSLSDLLFCTEPSGVEHLRHEGVSQTKVHLVGNLMIDTLLRHRQAARESTILARLGAEPHGYTLLTMHRPSNVDDLATFGRIMTALDAIQQRTPIVFPIHPRTRALLAGADAGQRLNAMLNLKLIEPAGYLDFMKLMMDARVVMTDSGGVQEETAVLQVPCLTLRENTERPITVECGWNRIVGTDPAAIVAAWNMVVDGPAPGGRPPELWDGHTAGRIAEVMLKAL